jgi:hypothetical protein
VYINIKQHPYALTNGAPAPGPQSGQRTCLKAQYVPDIKATARNLSCQLVCLEVKRDCLTMAMAKVLAAVLLLGMVQLAIGEHFIS